MFHVKHTYFAGLKTLILSNTACLEPSFTLRREPARYALDLAPGSDRYDKLLALAIAPQILTKETPNSLSSLSRAGSMIIQQDNTRPSTSLNTFIDKASPRTTSQHAHAERLVPLQTHTAATHISADNKYSPSIKTAKSTKTRRMISSDSPAKTTKTSINIAFLSPFHVKHRLKSHISTPLNPSALPHDRRQQTTKHIGQCKHAPFILSRSFRAIYTACRTPYNFASIWAHCPITHDTRQQQSLFAQCRAATQTPP